MNTGTGTVAFFDAAKGFGFIRPDDGSKDVFVHITAVKSSGLGDVNESQRLSYDLDRGSDGKPFAFNLKTV
jgi:CspA family cold shock protein